MKPSSYLFTFIVAAALLSASAAMAHHSDSTVDKTKTLSIKGTIKVFSWTAPHAQVIVNTVDDKGQPVEIGVSTFTPAALLLQGLSPKDFRHGDPVEVFYHPNRSGAPGGILVKLIGRGGKVLNGEPGAPPASAPAG